MLSHLHGVSYAAVHGEAATATGGDGGPIQLVGLLLCVLVRRKLALALALALTRYSWWACFSACWCVGS